LQWYNEQTFQLYFEYNYSRVQSDVCITCREFSAVEVEAYNRLNGVEPLIMPDQVAH